MIDKIMQHRGG